MDDWDLEAPATKNSDPSGGEVPRGPVTAAEGRGAEIGAEAAAGKAAASAPQVIGTVPPPGRPARLGPGHTVALVICALVLLLIGALAGFFIARSQGDTTSAELSQATQQLGVVEKGLAESEERNWNYYRENQALQTQIEELQKGSGSGVPTTSTSTTVPGQPAVYTDGIYRVGEEISPGEYDGVVTRQVGYWARLRGTEGVVGAIVANGLATGPFVLTINSSDVAVELRGVKITSR